MKKYNLLKNLVVLLILISFQAQAQEKRLALVIGNSSYEQGFLKNPVNDALLISETLKSLGFDVILKTNIANIKEFNDAVKEFGERRNLYNVGFIYYAGHAVQIDNINYLLATTEEYKTDYDVTVNAFSVQTMMRFLTDRSEEVNVLILDACRDNPFEKNWIKTSRSSDGGGGLAKINPPTGSLIAYSTDPGNTAEDGDDKNSLYCMSLSKNMLLENTSLDQVFRNVRADVLAETNNKQRPVEATQLTGEAFYLKKSTYLKDIKVIDSLIEMEDYTPALVKATSILTLDPNNMQALLRKGRISYNTLKNKYDGLDLKKAAKLYPNAPEVFIYLYRYYSTIENENEAFKQIKFALQLDSSYAETHYWLATYYMDTENNKEALVELNKVIELDPKNGERYYKRAVFFQYYQQDNNMALLDYSKAIELDPENIDYLYGRGNFYTEYLLDDKSAIKDFEKILKIAPDYINAINSIGVIYERQGNLDLAIKEYEKGIALETTNPEAAAYCYSNRAGIYEKQNLLDKALADYSKAIELDSKNGERYYNRALYYSDFLKDNNLALIDYSRAIDLDPENVDNLYGRAVFYYEYLLEDKSAIKDCEQILKIAPENLNAINFIGVIYERQGKLDLAIKEYEKGIVLETTNPEAAAWCYSNRALIYGKQNLLDKALADYSKAIELDPKNAERYDIRARFFLDKKDNNMALLDFSRAIELNPENLDYLYNRGVTNYLLNDKSSIKDFEQVLKIDPTYVNAINYLGNIYQKQGKLDLAIKEYEKGIALESTNPEAASYCYSNRARIYEKQNLLDKALADYSKAIELDPKNAERHNIRAFFFIDYQKDNNKALLDISRAIELDPENIGYLYDRGNFYTEYLLDDKSAIKDFEKILKIAPDYIDAINSIGVIYYSQGKLDLAIKEYEKGIALETTNPESAAYCYSNRAGIYEKQNLLDKALADYSKAIELDPKNAERHNIRAFFFIDYQKDNNKALLDFSRAIELDPENIGYLYDRGNFYTDYLLDDKSAIKDFEKILKIAPDDIDAINSIGIIYDRQGKLDLAIKEYEKGIALEITSPESAAYCYSNRAGIYKKQNLLDKALADYSKAIELEPKNAERHNIRAFFFIDYQKDNNKALLDFSRAIELDPENIGYLYDRGNFYTDYLLDDKSAIKDFEKILKIAPDDIDAINSIGIIYERQGNLDLAIKEYEKGIALETTNPEAAAYCYSNCAGIYEKQNLLDKALADYSKAIELDPENGERYYNRAVFYTDYLQEYDKALMDYSKAIELEPKNGNRYADRAIFYTDYLKEYDKALIDYSKAMEIDPENEILISSRAHVYYKKGDLKSALDDYNLIVKKFPNLQSSYNKRGMFYSKTENYEKAERDYERAITLDSNDRSVYYYKSKMHIQKKEYELAKNGLIKTIKMDDKDPEGYYYLAEIYALQGKYIQAIKNISLAISILENKTLNYYISDLNDEAIPISQVYYKLGTLYEKLKEKELVCEYYQKALAAIENETRPDKIEFKKRLKEQIIIYCNE